MTVSFLISHGGCRLIKSRSRAQPPHTTSSCIRNPSEYRYKLRAETLIILGIDLDK
jgi:hypothetical protein